jgi:hypothetical protein
MPNPVTFDVSVGSIPEGFEGDLQSTLNLFASRLLISPSVPWSSFVLGAAQPSSDVGPWFKDGQELRVWDPVLATYVPGKLNGTGVLPASLPLGAIQDLPPQQVLISDINGRPSFIGGSPGQIVKIASSGTPVFENPATGQAFTGTLGANFPFASDGNQKLIPFSSAFGPAAPNFNNTSYQFIIPAGGAGYWFFYASVQISDINAPSSNVVHNLVITRNGGLDGTAGSINTNVSAQNINGVSVTGLFPANAGDSFDVRIASTSNNLTGLEFEIDTNGANTRFGGFRLI